MGKALRVVVLAALIGSSLAAQDEPDFTGRWVLESPSQPSPDIPAALSVRQSVVSKNVRGEPMKPFFRDITVVRELANRTSSETYEIGVVGGSLGGSVAGESPSRHFRVLWEKQVLVIESGSYTGSTPESGQWTERREAWSLDPDGRLRLAITSRSSDSDLSTVTLVYRPQ